MTRKCGREVRGRHHCVLKISAYKALAGNRVYQSQYVGAMCSFASNVYNRYTLSNIICSPERCQCLGGVYPRSSLWTNVQHSRNRTYDPIGSTDIWWSPVAASVVKPEYKLFQFRVSRSMSMAGGPDDPARLVTRIKWYIQAETLLLDPNLLQQGQPLRDSGGAACLNWGCRCTLYYRNWQHCHLFSLVSSNRHSSQTLGPGIISRGVSGGKRTSRSRALFARRYLPFAVHN